MHSDTPLKPLQFNGAAYGWLLGVATLLTLVFIAHHPVADIRHLPSVAAAAGPGRLVHGGLIVLVLLSATGFSGFAWRLGIGHPLVMAGWLSQIVAATAMVTAAITDGFVIPDLAARMAGDADLARSLITLCGCGIQAAAKLAFVLMALSAVFWGLALQHHKGGARWIGLLGIAAGGISVAFVLTMTQGFNVERLFTYVAAQSAWYLVVAIWLIRGLKQPE